MSNQLKKQISLFSLTMIAVGSSIGSGVFRTPSEIAGYLPTTGWMLLPKSPPFSRERAVFTCF
jgi:APA family basic amino acid/polyamine antiporter